MFEYRKTICMEYFENLDSFYVDLALLVVFALGSFVTRKHPLKARLQYGLYFYGVVILLLSLRIPFVFKGFPYEISDLDNKKRLLYHLQKSNEALLATTEVLRKFVFVTFIFFLSNIKAIINHLKVEKSSE